jgi:hypothetical protein
MSVYEFDEKEHVHRLNGVIIPGLSALLDSAGLVSPWIKNDAAAERGSNGHLLCKMCYTGTQDDYTIPDASKPWVDAILRFMQDYKIVPFETLAYGKIVETPMWSIKGFAGIPDLLTEDLTLYDNKFWMAVVPSSKDNAGIQLAGYSELIAERLGVKVKKRRIVVFNIDKKHPYEVHELKDTTDLPLFQSCLNLWTRKAKYEKLTPIDSSIED